MPRISVAQLFEDNRDRLRLAWIAGRDGGVKELDPGNLKDSHEGLIGHLNFIHPNWIQVIARPEIDHLNSLDPVELMWMLRPYLARSLSQCITLLWVLFDGQKLQVPIPLSIAVGKSEL